MLRHLLMLLLSTLAMAAQAIEKLEVQGLFANRAVLLVDGQRHVLAVNESSPEGVKLISADSYGAVLEVDGQRKSYRLGNTVTTSYAEKKSQKKTIYKDPSGMYLTYGNINGQPVRFLVDTGASAISMNSRQADELGIDYRKYGTAAGVSTASGYASAYRVKLNSVAVGDISQSHVEAFVIEGSHPGPILLGMTFLGRLDVEHRGNALTLTQK
jgi:aspartyl protease family protein